MIEDPANPRRAAPWRAVDADAQPRTPRQAPICWSGWCVAEAGTQFRRVNGYLRLAALGLHVAAQVVGAVRQHEPVIAA
jgi:hypothetical protein